MNKGNPQMEVLTFKILYKELQVLCGFVLESVVNPRTEAVFKWLHISFYAISFFINLTLRSLSFQGTMETEVSNFYTDDLL